MSTLNTLRLSQHKALSVLVYLVKPKKKLWLYPFPTLSPPKAGKNCTLSGALVTTVPLTLNHELINGLYFIWRNRFCQFYFSPNEISSITCLHLVKFMLLFFIKQFTQSNDLYKEKYFPLDLVAFIFHRSTAKQTSWREYF